MIIKPHQAAGLLAKNNLYLTEACKRGVKGGMEKIYDWFALVTEHSAHLAELV